MVKNIDSTEIVTCLCGCGLTRERYDELGKERKYIVGHNFKNNNKIKLTNEQKKEIIKCACGCGKLRLRYDPSGHERIYIIGHKSKDLREKINKNPERISKIKKTMKKLFENKELEIWNKGKRGVMIFDEEHNKKISEKRMGMKFSKEHKDKLKITRAKQIFPKKDSSIEVKIQNFLTQLQIEYFTHKYMHIEHGYQCDIFIPIQDGFPKNTIIECDGDTFHYNPIKYNKDSKIFENSLIAEERWNLDESRTKELIEKGYRVIRLWECEINDMNLNHFQEKLKNA